MSQAEAKVLQEVPQERAFYFNRDEISSLNVSARSLEEFLEKLRTIEERSLQFHSSRGDFERWVEMLGDLDLVKRLAEIRQENLVGENLRTRLVQTVQRRYEQLRRPKTVKRRKAKR